MSKGPSKRPRASRRVKTDTGAGRSKERRRAAAGGGRRHDGPRHPPKAAPGRQPEATGRGEPGPRTARLRMRRRSDHPWIFKRMIRDVGREAKSGDEVAVEDADGKKVGRALYHARSEIALRVLSDDPAERFDAAFFGRRIGAALAFRREALDIESVTDAYRLVHGEADGLSGLVIDRYGRWCVAEVHSLGMWLRLGEIEKALHAVIPGSRMLVRADQRASRLEGFGQQGGPPEKDAPEKPVAFHERGVVFHADLRAGQKTGAFLDQRDNRRAFCAWTKGRRVLDAFCHAAGFGVWAAQRGEAKSVIAVDADGGALDLGKKNLEANKITKVELVCDDVFRYLRALPEKPQFEAMVLDPPKLAHDRDEAGAARRKSFDLHRCAFPRLADGGALMTCNCTGLLSDQDFIGSVAAAARETGYRLRIVETRGAAPDHPVAGACPETRYLTAVMAVAQKLR